MAEKYVPLKFQSNSIRGKMLQDVMDRTIHEMYLDMVDMLGPGATDGWFIKDQAPYYTRDGKETSETLTFDNELANYIHHIMFQAIYNQGRNVGDGSTTLGIMYMHMYELLRENKDYRYDQFFNMNLNKTREHWKEFTDNMVNRLKKLARPMDDELLKSMLYTCTQDPELTVKIYENLRDPIMAGAYITPRKSNIASDFNITVYNSPVIRVVRQWSLKPMKDIEPRSVIYYVNGQLDIAHSEMFASLALVRNFLNPEDASTERNNTIIFLCHGLSDATRRAIKEFVAVARDNGWDMNHCNNIAIYTMSDYRIFEPDEIEDIVAIISGEDGIGGMVNPITFETYLYRAFPPMAAMQGLEPIDELETFDCDTHIIDKIKENFLMPYEVKFDDIEGMAINRTLPAVAQKRYDELREEIKNEKSQVRRLSLSKRLRRCYGMFIDLEVGSVLLKDSQRKFELILDAIISSAEAARDGVIVGNSSLWSIVLANTIQNEPDSDDPVFGYYSFKEIKDGHIWDPFAGLWDEAMMLTMKDLIRNQTQQDYSNYQIYDGIATEERLKAFNALNHDDIFPREFVNNIVATEDSKGDLFEINAQIVEPVNVMKAIIENSLVPIELIRTKVFHLTRPALGNWVE